MNEFLHNPGKSAVIISHFVDEGTAAQSSNNSSRVPPAGTEGSVKVKAQQNDPEPRHLLYKPPSGPEIKQSPTLILQMKKMRQPWRNWGSKI